jgi:transcriptional regulator with GAF, ATPase, and Fis domain
MKGTAAETSRVAILLVDGYMLRTWEHVGFAEGKGPTEMPIGAAGTLAAAVALKQTSFVPTVIAGSESAVPAFMRVPAGHTGLVVPLTVGGDVVAVLYADDVARAVEQEDAPLWTEEVQLLARHAALALENVTSVRTVEVLAGTD